MTNPLGNKLKQVSKPGRYVGNEFGAFKKAWDSSDVRWVIAFPDIYEIGMSHLGTQILYNIINQQENYLADRAYTPWNDMQTLLKEEKKLLWGLESGKPLNQFDIVGITIPYELTYTNILSILDLGGVPLLSKDRKENDPIVIGGGSGSFNPEPVADFFDAILIGEGEDKVVEISKIIDIAKKEKHERNEILERLAEVESLYVPSVPRQNITKNTLKKVDQFNLEHVLVSNIQPVHDRVGIEIQRGCTRGCRFCQAGMIYRPTRQFPAKQIEENALRLIQNSGYDECAFLSLSAGDHNALSDIAIKLDREFNNNWVHLSLPSLRTESLNKETIRILSRSLKGGFTLAPEAATERLRKVINKGNTETDLMNSIEKIFSAGWSKIKLYFMIGLPTEREEDISAIADLTHRALKLGREKNKRAEITVNVSTFVPKPHTPFQWESQISIEATKRIQNILKSKIKNRRIKLKFHDPYQSFLEGCFSRGDRRLSDPILKAYKLGSSFDSWNDRFDFEKWMKAFEECNINPSNYLKERDITGKLPWDHIYSNLDKRFLLRERENAYSNEVTPDCRVDRCSGCGICDFKDIFPDVVSSPAKRETLNKNENIQTEPIRYIINFRKKGDSVFFGHLDYMRLWKMALRRVGLPLRFSQGYNPRPKISLLTPLPLGMASNDEWCEVELTRDIDVKDIKEKLAINLPSGTELIEVAKLGESKQKLTKRIRGNLYKVTLPPTNNYTSVSDKISSFHESDSYMIEKESKKGKREIDLKRSLISLAEIQDNVIEVGIKTGESSIGLYDLMHHLFGFDPETARSFDVIKEKTCLMN